jgi:membrane protein required for colicin V production
MDTLRAIGAELTVVDIAVLLLVVMAAIRGVMNGLVAELLSLAAWLVGMAALRFGHAPLTEILRAFVTMPGAASVLAAGLLFIVGFLLTRVVAGRIGATSRKSVLGPIDRALGLGFGAVKALAIATVVFLGFTLGYDTVFGGTAERPQWLTASRTYPLLRASGDALVAFVDRRRAR